LQQQYSQQPDDLQVLDQLLDLDQLLLDFAASAFSEIGAPARRVLQLLRALLLLFIKNIRSENFLVHTELKNNLLYRWFVRLEKDEVPGDGFRIGLVRLRARLTRRLKPGQWQAFLAKTISLAQAQHHLLSVANSEIETAARQTAPAKARPDTGPPEVSEVTFDLTPAKARARILDQRDRPKTPKPDHQPSIEAQSKKTGNDKQSSKTTINRSGQKSTTKNKTLPRSAGDPDAYWITKRRRGAAGRLTETTLGYEVGFFATHSQGLITGVVVREAEQANRTEFTNWVDQYQKDWQLGPGQLEISADGEFSTGEILKYFEQNQQRLCVPVSEPTVAKGKLDHRYFSYFASEDIFVCHEGAELKRIGHDKQKQRTRYRAPIEACAHCPTASLCKGGAGPRKVSRSDFADQFARAKEQAQTEQHRDARWAQHVYGEGSFAHSNCNHGLDHARYYGRGQMLLQAYWTAAAMNLKKAVRFQQARLSADKSSLNPVPT
jgi:hypothetical protein